MPLFEDTDTGKEITIAISRKTLEEKVKEARLNIAKQRTFIKNRGSNGLRKLTRRFHHRGFSGVVGVRGEMDVHACLSSPTGTCCTSGDKRDKGVTSKRIWTRRLACARGCAKRRQEANHRPGGRVVILSTSEDRSSTSTRCGRHQHLPQWWTMAVSVASRCRTCGDTSHGHGQQRRRNATVQSKPRRCGVRLG